MGIIFDLQTYKAEKDVRRSIIQTHRPDFNRKPATLHLQQFAMHAKKIVYFEEGAKEWKFASAYSLAEALKNSQYHLTQPSKYRTRLYIMEDKICFVDIYFSRSIYESESWQERMNKLVHESLRNKGSVSRDLYIKFYTIRSIATPMPLVDWKALEKKPYLDDD